MNLVNRKRFLIALVFSSLFINQVEMSQSLQILPNKDTILLTVFLKHDQSMVNVQRGDALKESGVKDMFPPKGV